MGFIDDFLGRAAVRRRQAARPAVEAPAVADPMATGFDEFGAPEGAFGRLEALAGEVRVSASVPIAAPVPSRA